MIDIKFLRSNPEIVKENIKKIMGVIFIVVVIFIIFQSIHFKKSVSFRIQVASGLEISVDGKNWGEEITWDMVNKVSQENENAMNQLPRILGSFSTVGTVTNGYLDMYQVYNAKDGMVVLEEIKEQIKNEFDELENKTVLKPKKISGTVLTKLKACVKVDVTPKSAYDKYATEQILENYFTQGLITLDEYVKALPDDSIAPKQKLEEILKHREEEQSKIQQIEKQAIAMQNKMNGYIQANERINNIDNEGQQLIEQLTNQNTTEM